MLRSLALVTVLTLATGCALIPPSRPDLAFYPSPRDPGAIKISRTLYRAAQAVGDDPDYYSFALIQTNIVTSFVGSGARLVYLNEAEAENIIKGAAWARRSPSAWLYSTVPRSSQ